MRYNFKHLNVIETGGKLDVSFLNYRLSTRFETTTRVEKNDKTLTILGHLAFLFRFLSPRE